MDDDITIRVIVDTDFQSYETFFGNVWSNRITALVKPFPVLDRLVLDLMMLWRAASYTMQLPTSVVRHLKAFHDGYINEGSLETVKLELMGQMAALLAFRIPELTADPNLSQRIRAECFKMADDFAETRKKVRVEFPLNEVWQDYIKEHVIQLGLWGSQRIAYVAIYNAYEDFVVHLVKAVTGLPSVRTRDQAFRQCLRSDFGEPLYQSCWTNPQIYLAREVRHSLAHAGGRLTEDLEKAQAQNHFEFADDRVQIQASNTKALYKTLEDASFALAEKAIDLPAFKSAP